MTPINSRNANKRKHSVHIGQISFETIIFIVSIILFVLPFLNLFAISVSSSRAVLSGEVFFWPIETQFNAWKEVFKNQPLIHSLFFTIFLTFTYCILALILIMLAAYPLSRRDLKGRGKFMVYFMITMYFSGGMIPSYLLIQALQLMDTFWALLLPSLFSVFNMLILKTFYQGIPDSFEESAKIDGANDFQILFKIYFPLSLPAMATLALFFAVSRWNSFSDAIFYLPTRKDLNPLQVFLQQMLQAIGDTEKQLQKLDGSSTQVKILSDSQKAANILFTVVPILMVYPWLQKYFVKGVMIGSIKG